MCAISKSGIPVARGELLAERASKRSRGPYALGIAEDIRKHRQRCHPITAAYASTVRSQCAQKLGRVARAEQTYVHE